MGFVKGEVVKFDGYLAKVMKKKKDRNGVVWYSIEVIDKKAPFQFFTMLATEDQLKKANISGRNG